MNVQRTSKYFFLKLLRLKGSPHSIALGAGIGVFIGLTPTIPLHTVIILFLTLLTRTSFFAGLITSILVSNPLTYVPHYYLALLIGNLVTPFHLNWDRVKQVLDLVLADASFEARLKPLLSIGYEAVVVMLTGGITLSLPAAVITYYLCRSLVTTYRRRRRQKQILS
ncbi:MAG: DUF2062 domain-containing protein [Desulfofustis sp.]